MVEDPDVTSLSVVLITRNGMPRLVDQLDAVLSQTWSGTWELVVVDNDSDDATAQTLATMAAQEPRVRIINARQRRSVAYARNQGAEHARCSYVAFIDDDDLVGVGWLQNMAVSVSKYQYVAAQIDLHLLNHEILADARSSLTRSEIGHIGEIPMPAGATIAVRRDWFLAVGGADERFTAGAEDLDWAVRFHIRYGIEPTRCEGAIYHVRLRSDPMAALSQGFRYGRAYVQLFCRWQGILPRPAPLHQIGAATRSWLGLAARIPAALISRPKRAVMAFELGRSIGRLAGTIEYRFMFL